jgi:LPXTG-motif cell wall-anchored protein
VIGNPEDCLDEKAPPAEQPPGGPGGLPRTGAELEVQAAVGLMLLLLGFGLARRSKRVA